MEVHAFQIILRKFTFYIFWNEYSGSHFWSWKWLL